MIAWFVKNTVAANLLMITIVLAGLFSLSTKIPLEVFPSFTTDRISVKVLLRGATPEDVEQGVTIRIEEAVQDLDGVEKITSSSTEGFASVIIEVTSGYDERDMLADIKSRVDAINTFPVDAEKPIVALAQRKQNVISVTLASEHGEKEIREYSQQISDDLLNISGITQLSLSGIRNYEIAIEVSQDKLQQYHLSLQQISQAIANSSVDISAGNIKTRGGDVLIRSKGQAYRKNDFANIAVTQNADGSILRLQDIPRFAELGVIASMQATHATSDKNMAQDRLGDKRILGAYAWQKLIKANAIIAGGSDFPVESANPFFGLHASVTRQDKHNQPATGWLPKETMSIKQAFKTFTLNAAYAAHQEKLIGSLKKNKKADFIILDQDIFKIHSSELWKTKVLQTWVDGKKVSYP